MEHDIYEERMTDDSLRMELRNPSDALQILARSSDASSKKPSSHHWRQCRDSPVEIADMESSIPPPSSPIDTTSQIRQDRNYDKLPTTALDNYDLIQRGLLHPSVLPELLHTSAV